MQVLQVLQVLQELQELLLPQQRASAKKLVPTVATAIKNDKTIFWNFIFSPFYIYEIIVKNYQPIRYSKNITKKFSKSQLFAWLLSAIS